MFSKHLASFTASAADFRKAFNEAEGDWDALPERVREKFVQAEGVLGKFEHNFNHHSKVHIDMITYFASSENLARECSSLPSLLLRRADGLLFSPAVLALVVRLTNVRSAP